MSEFLENAKRITAENHAAEQRRQNEAARQRAKEESDRQLSHERAKDFVGIMRAHNIDMIPLCREGDYNHIPPMQWLKAQFAHVPARTVPPDSAYRRLQQEQGYKITMFRMGWIAAQNYSYNSDDSVYHVPGIFVSDKAETFLYSYQAVSKGTPYVAPVDSEKLGRLRGASDEGLLAAEDAVERVGQMLVQYGING